MKHVRLPLTPKDYILNNVVKEPLLNNCLECKEYVIEALHYHLLKSDEFITIPHNIRTKPRQPGGTHNVILVVGGLGCGKEVLDSTEWDDPKVNRWQSGPNMIATRYAGCLAVIKHNIAIYMLGMHLRSAHQSVDLSDLSSESPCWKPSVDMLVKRKYFGVGVIKNYVYAVGGFDGNSYLKNAEHFDCRTQEWRMVSSMATRRMSFGIGVLNHLLYAVGGCDSEQRLNCVECYHPSLDIWTSVAEMCVRRSDVSIGVLNGVLYAVGGCDGHQVWSSVEAYRPSTGVWSTIPDMHLARKHSGVAVLDGLLYVVGGNDGSSTLNSVESYNPNTNTWTMITESMNVKRDRPGVVVIDMPRNFKTF